MPIFALRSKNDLGVGDTECVREMIDWCANHRFSLLQLLPINESGNDNSPYNAISSMALDPTTITISPRHLADLTPTTFRKLAPRSLLKELRQGPVQYQKVKLLKLQLLRAAFARFLKIHDVGNTERARQFRAFRVANKGWMDDYALFRTLVQQHHNSAVWDQWPPEHSSPTEARKWIQSLPATGQNEFNETLLFFSYIQFIARQQWTDLKRYGEQRGVALMGDIPFGIARYSADVWANRPLFDLKWSCGAPPETFFNPDLFTEKWGQNWGIPLYRWDKMKEDSYTWWRARVRGTSKFFHFFRIDHVLGFYRIYAFPWRPEENHLFTPLSREEARAKAGDPPRFWPGDDNHPQQKLLNQEHGEELLRAVLDAAGATGVVGEDLGMVPDYVRPSLMQLGIPGFKIPLFERNPDGSYKDPTIYEPLSVATLATHDHEPMAALWKRWETAPEGAAERRHLLNWIGWDSNQPPHEFTGELHAAICRKLLACPSWMAIFMITDLFAQTQRFNVPGPMSESNWTERLAVPVSQWDDSLEIAARARILQQLIHESGRTSTAGP